MSNELADILFRMIRWILLNLSDKRLAQLSRIVRRLAYAFTGNEDLNSILGEIVDIFESGPPGTDVIRKMFREAYRPYAAAVVRGFRGL
jgi:hypothetical protein